MEMRAKNLVADGPEIYFFKAATEGVSIPFYCKLAAVWYTLSYQLDTSSTYNRSRAEMKAEYAQAWWELLKGDASYARDVVERDQRGSELVQAMAKEEFSNPVARLRIIIWLVVIAVVVVGSFVLLGAH